ncbi:cell envelope integrity protein TolA [Variovorax sp. NFACC27]|jgi:colicin import membrane protein|uniref:Cell envelope integrity protein TolA n=1 Tax=Variovorax gossypii TaxID=1679495 RepID=A0A431TPX7_9BURK|nr:cell envelope integrity protein TolA [Variovorax gossypii]MDP9602879.1 colicin import membrane protein [Variovorax paradoxus]SEF31696.1 colicin import membrane protein [Variovorax sp. NFACC28]SEG81489.1 colicin import membrane protein [Variovorax sp. NFACC29]SFD10856.1 colicin import membrane protein [Variovorax sp. NFACC26]SFG17370.1 colicin import membrane protein [Variovorax sp. NFACC27]
MSLALDRPEFAPPPQRGTGRALVLALIAHGLLIAALTWGVRWRSDADEGAVDAELWSSTVQQAAPRLQAPPAPAPVPAPPPPAPAPPPPPAAKAPEPAPAPKAPDIALEREKKLKEQKEQQERELERQQQQKKKELEAKQRAEDEAQRKKEQQQKLAEQKKQQEAEAKQAEQKKAETAAKQAAADRAAALKRMQGLANATGSDDSRGTAQRTSGPSSGYAGRIAAAVRPNITFPDADTVNGNPAAEFEVSLAPDGTIVGVKLSKSSGLPGWDDAAERGLRKTDKLPRDTDGRIFPSLIVTLRPKR